MKKVTKYSLIAGTTLGLVAMVGVAGLKPANASSKYLSKDNIIEKISERFSLDKNELEKFVEEERFLRHTERLNELLSEGKITQEQKDLMEKHFGEMQTKRNEILNSDKTEAEKEQALDDLREEGRQFREDNDLPKPGKGEGRGGMGEGRGHRSGLGR